MKHLLQTICIMPILLFSVKAQAQECQDSTSSFTILKTIDERLRIAGRGKEMAILDSLENECNSCLNAPERWLAGVRLARAKKLYDWGYNAAVDSILQRIESVTSGFEDKSDLMLNSSASLRGGLLIRMEDFHGAIRVLREALKRVPEEGRPYLMERVAIINRLGIAYKRVGLLDQSIKTYDEGIEITNKSLDGHVGILTQFLSNKANVLYRKGQVAKSIEVHKYCLEVIDKSGESRAVDSVRYLNNIANAYLELKAFDEVIEYATQAIALRRTIGKEQTIEQLVTLSLRTSSHHAIGNSRLAEEDINRMRTIFEALPPRRSIQSAFFLLYQAEFYREIGKASEAMPVYDMVKRLAEERFAEGQFTYDLSSLFNTLGGAATALISPDSAVANYRRALAVLNGMPQVPDSKLANTHGNLAAGFLETNQLDSSYHHANIALAITLPTYDIDFYRNVDEIPLPRSLIRTSKVAVKLYDRGGPLEDLQKELERTNFAIQLMDLAQQQSQNYSAQSIGQYGKLIIAQAAEMTWRLALATGGAKYNAEIIRLSERAKNYDATARLERNRNLSEVASKLLNQERSLQAEVTRREVSRLEIGAQGATQDVKDSLDLVIVQLKDSLINLRERIEEMEELSGFRPFVVPSVSEMQEALSSPKQAFLGYLLADESVFATLVRKDTFMVVRTEVDSAYLSRLNQFYAGLLNEDRSGFGDDFRGFYQNARYLYSAHLEPLEEMLTEQLIVLPDPALGQLPIDLLVMDDVSPDDIFEPQRYPFALQKYSISYALNTSLYLQSTMSQSFVGKYEAVAAAPFVHQGFKDDRGVGIGDLGPIPASEEEVINIAKLLNTQPIIDGTATESHITDLLSSASIAHISTHGIFDPTIGEQVGLVFYPIEDELENEILYLQEIYNLDVSADLLVLSACDTDLGKKAQGEGTLSLSRAFSLAGARSVVATQWMVRGPQTTELMTKFYELMLNEGEDKVSALAKAKRWFLNKSSGPQAHPYYWGGAVLSGHTGSLR